MHSSSQGCCQTVSAWFVLEMDGMAKCGISISSTDWMVAQVSIYIPRQWKKAWLAFLPKPNRPPTSLINLRPIELQEPLGKAVLGLVRRKFIQEITRHLAPWPSEESLSTANTHIPCCRIRDGQCTSELSYSFPAKNRG